ncbi:MAG TPA: transcription antitermination factor NusB [Bacillota bacterium]|nr:transcription antitermination factor NusB [Bacillota bacterium]
MKRRTAREYALKILFSMDINFKEPEEAIQDFLQTKESDPFLNKLVKGVYSHLEQIDHVISSHLENWTIDRIATVEKTILRIAVYEIEYEDDIPKEVSINEAIEIAKKYSDEKSGKFINGVLSKLL